MCHRLWKCRRQITFRRGSAMTTGAQRILALIYTGGFLEELAAAKSVPDFQNIKDRAQQLLRHYPSSMEIAWVAEATAQSPYAVMGSPLDPTAVPREIQKGYRRWQSPNHLWWSGSLRVRGTGPVKSQILSWSLLWCTGTLCTKMSTQSLLKNVTNPCMYI